MDINNEIIKKEILQDIMLSNNVLIDIDLNKFSKNIKDSLSDYALKDSLSDYALKDDVDQIIQNLSSKYITIDFSGTYEDDDDDEFEFSVVCLKK